MSLTVALFALPFHILMIKILIKDVDLSMPRHQIMLSLSTIDTLQIFSATAPTVVIKALELTTESLVCSILRAVLVFGASLTIVTGSLTLVTLAIERMTICMYFLKYRRLFSRKRTQYVLYSYWVVGLIISVITTATNDKQKAETVIGDVTSLAIISTILVIPSAVIIATIQFRLIKFSRARMVRIVPTAASTNQLAVPDFRKRQLRIAFVAGIVSVAYIVCMLPLAMMYFFQIVGLIDDNPTVQSALIGLAMVNTLADPFIYGLGMVQTRKAIIKVMRRFLPACIVHSQ